MSSNVSKKKAKDLPRSTIIELIALYTLEKDVCDVIVEGRDDVGIIAWYLRRKGKNNFAVKEVAGIDIPTALVLHHGLPDGSSGRVRALALELAKSLTDDAQRRVRLVVDADFALVTGNRLSCALLFYTDFANMEMYLFSVRAVDKLLSVVLSGASVTAEVVMATIATPLQRLFLIRLVNELDKQGRSWLTATRCCACARARIEFDEDEFVRRYNGNSAARVAAFSAELKAKQAMLTAEPRNQMHGHDFIEILQAFLRDVVRDKNPLDDEQAFARTVFGCVEFEELDNSKLFQSLSAHVAK